MSSTKEYGIILRKIRMKLTRAKLDEDAKRMEADGVPEVLPEGMTEDAPSLTLEDMKNNLTTPLVAKGLMAPMEGIFPHGGRFPSSRDWNMPTIKCARKTCAANYKLECVMPSLIEMDAKGKCKGYHKRASGKAKK